MEPSPPCTTIWTYLSFSELTNRADAVFFIYAGTPGLVYDGQVTLNIGWQKAKLAVDLSIWTIYCMKHLILPQTNTFFVSPGCFSSNLRTFLSNFVATDVYALSIKFLKSLPAVFFPFLVWAKFWVPPLPRIWSWDIVFDSRDHYFWYSRTQGFSKIYHIYGF